MSEITNTEYWAEIKSIAESMAAETMEETDNDREAAEEIVNDSRLHETIDGHQWVIYYAYNLDVIRHAENESYYEDNFGGDDMAAVMKEGGLDKLHTVVAFWAMYADVQDYLPAAFDALEGEAD